MRQPKTIFYLALILMLLLLIYAIGCTAAAPPRTMVTGNALARIDVRAQGIGENATRLIPHVDAAGTGLLEVVGTDAGRIRVDAAEAKAANEKAAAQQAELFTKYDRLYHSIGATVQRWVVRFAWALGIAAVAALALRIVALNATGPWGAAASFVSTGIFGVMSGGLSLVQSVFDNLWFRKFSPAAAKRTTAAEEDQ
ncbi:MAG: hypothetical protein IT447_16765 [Phycisphaerales bacterium]|nr:hypothetical protein [Phycisphaerales bacterium]